MRLLLECAEDKRIIESNIDVGGIDSSLDLAPTRTEGNDTKDVSPRQREDSRRLETSTFTLCTVKVWFQRKVTTVLLLTATQSNCPCLVTFSVRSLNSGLAKGGCTETVLQHRQQKAITIFKFEEGEESCFKS